jgi:maleate isomerase
VGHSGSAFSERFFEVIGLRGLELASGEAYVAVEPAAWYRIVREAAVPGADAILVSCTNIRVLDVVERLESDLDCPLVTSNQAAVWHCLRRLDLPDRVPGYGRLLAEALPLPSGEPVGAGRA